MNIQPKISKNLPLLPSADYAAINVAALRNGRSLIQELFPGVRIRSLECIIGDFVINYRDFTWKDRSTAVTGADLISGLAHVYGYSHDEAARLVAEKLAVPEAGAHRNNNPASIPLDDEQSGWRDEQGPDSGGFEGFEGSQGSHFSASEAPKDWREPKPLPSGLSPVDEFDGRFLPDAIAPWVMDIANRLQCPPDYVGITAMVGLGAILGRRVGIKPQMRTDWIEVPNLWGAFVGRPGWLKSPAMGDALKPLHRLEAEAIKKNEAAQQAYLAELQAFKAANRSSCHSKGRRLGKSQTTSRTAGSTSAMNPENRQTFAIVLMTQATSPLASC
jgi:hypothetical protein